MRTKNTSKRLFLWALVVTGILMIPLVGNFPWSYGDFIIAGVVLFGCATVYELITRNLDNKIQRLGVAFAVGMVIMLIWAWAVA